MHYRFTNQVVFVNGGSRGLGLLLGREVAREGARIFIIARKQQELEKAADHLLKSGAKRVEFSVCDVSKPGAMESAFAHCRATLGPVDVLFNVASVIQVGPWESMGERDFREAMEINFWGTYRAIECAAPEMMQRRSGRIMNIASIGGAVAVPHLLPYTAAKFAVRGFSEGLHAELARYGVRVTTIIPGLMRTGSFVNALFKGRRSQEFAWFSWSSSLPLVSMSSERAARKMIRACRSGRPELVVGMPAKVLRLAHDLFPNITIKVSSLINRMLPAPAPESDRMTEPGPGKLYRATERNIEKEA